MALIQEVCPEACQGHRIRRLNMEELGDIENGRIGLGFSNMKMTF